jgi:hypothetical protein
MKLLGKETYGGTALDGDFEELEACDLALSPFETGNWAATAGLSFELKMQVRLWNK